MIPLLTWSITSLFYNLLRSVLYHNGWTGSASEKVTLRGAKYIV